MKIVRGCLIAVSALLGIPVLLLVVWQIALNQEAEAKAWSQLTDHYGTTRITRNERVYFDPWRTTYYAYAQICYDVSVTLPSGTVVRKVAMVTGDNDGGTFSFSAEYPSMQACKAKFNRG